MLHKTNIIKLLCLVIITTFLSCDQSEIAENIDLTVDFTVDVNNVEFDAMILINAYNESQVLRNYGDNIKGIKILHIVYYLTYFTGPGGQQVNNGNLEVAGPDGAGTELIASISDENLQNLLYEQKEMTFQEEGAKRLEELIKNDPHEFRLHLSGTSNLAPNNYTLTLKIELQMIALPL